MRKESRKEEYDYEKRREDVHLSTIFDIQTDLTVSCIFIRHATFMVLITGSL